VTVLCSRSTLRMTLALALTLTTNAYALVTVIDDREGAGPGEWSAFDDPASQYTWNTGNVSPGAIIDNNTSAPLRGSQDIRVTGDTTINGDVFFLYRAFFKAPGTVTPTPVFVGIRVKQQPYTWTIQWRSRIVAANPNWVFESPIHTIPAGTGYYDAIIPLPDNGITYPIWFAVVGSPTMGAANAHQNYGFQSLELKVTLPNGTGPYDMQFDQMQFDDGSNPLPVSVSSFTAE